MSNDNVKVPSKEASGKTTTPAMKPVTSPSQPNHDLKSQGEQKVQQAGNPPKAGIQAPSKS